MDTNSGPTGPPPTDGEGADEPSAPAPHQVYGEVLAQGGFTGGLPDYLLTALVRRGANMQFIGRHMPVTLVGLHQMTLEWEHWVEHVGTQEIRVLLRRALDELGRLVDGLLADLQATVNDASRVLMEISVLLREFAVDPAQIEQWREKSPQPGNTEFNFSRVLRRLPEAKKLGKGLLLPELSEYNAHSMANHATFKTSSGGLRPGTYEYIVMLLHDAYRHVRDVSAAFVGFAAQQSELLVALPNCALPCVRMAAPPPSYLQGAALVDNEMGRIRDTVGLALPPREPFTWSEHPLRTSGRGPGTYPTNE